MITPVNNVSAVGAGDWVKSIGSVGGSTPSNSEASHQASEVDKSSFAALMQSPSAQNVARLEPAAQGSTRSMVEKFAATQNADMRELLQSTRDLVKAAPHLSMNEMAAFGHEMTLNLAITTTQFNVASNLGKTASKGVDTLMRNQ